MTPPLDVSLNLPPGVSEDHIRSVAEEAAHQSLVLAHLPGRPVEVLLAPGDMTQYRILLTPARITVGVGTPFCDEDSWIVTLLGDGEGHSWPWHPTNSGYTDSSYCLGHWTKHEHTARVLAGFLNALRDALQ